MILPALFHWSPRERRDEILRQGLRLFAASSGGAPDGLPMICLGTSPRDAWLLSGDTNWGREEEDWDLWQVTLADYDQVRVRTENGPRIWEVKVHNAIPADRLWWVGQRQPWLT